MTQHKAQAVPNGYRTVPTEPSESMLTAFSQHSDGAVFAIEFLRAYRAMLAAAPAAPQAEQQAEKTTCPFCESEWVTPAQHDKNLATHRAALAAQQAEREPLTDEQIDEIAGGRVDHFDRRVLPEPSSAPTASGRSSNE